MNYEIKLEEFQGPFDLLLHLVNKNEIDIFDIPIASITSQYMEYIGKMKEKNMELTSEFILMASRLIEIKSKLLLPVEEDDEGEEIDPREELAQRLYEYKIFKEISAYMKEKESLYMKTYFKDPEYIPFDKDVETEVDVQELLKALRNVLASNNLILEGEDKDVHTIQKEVVRIEDKIRDLEVLLQENPTIRFSMAFKGSKSVQTVVVTFLALLQLVKNNMVKFRQDKNFDEIIISRM